MPAIFARTALLPDGLADNVRIVWSGEQIEKVTANCQPLPGDDIQDLVFPAVPNLHSHAFQRAMAGMAEARGERQDSFWSWRDIMYRQALAITPDHLEAIASQLYTEMLEAGFGRVGEFHYLHNDRDGEPYDNCAEMSERVASAAAQTGLRLTLLPVFYAQSGFGGLPPSHGQRRFVSNLDQFARLVESARAVAKQLPHSRVGIAPHSLRAVTPDQLREIFPLAAGGPVHIHVAEQTREVEDCLAHTGQRPVEWLLENAPVDERWCLIHATHMTSAEIKGFARSGAIAGLCPITEANLGDGIFPARSFLESGGQFGIGSDSNIDITLSGELRALEYSQRLREQARNVIAMPDGSSGVALLTGATQGGAKALGAHVAIASGAPADFVTLDGQEAPWLSASQLLDAFVFSGGVNVDCVWIGGIRQVANGRHRHRDIIAARFRAAMMDLMAKAYV